MQTPQYSSRDTTWALLLLTMLYFLRAAHLVSRPLRILLGDPPLYCIVWKKSRGAPKKAPRRPVWAPCNAPNSKENSICCLRCFLSIQYSICLGAYGRLRWCFWQRQPDLHRSPVNGSVADTYTVGFLIHEGYAPGCTAPTLRPFKALVMK